MFVLLLCLLQWSLATRAHEAPLFSFNSTWHVLGPFQIGTRGTSMKATWGADPLEYAGGFRNLSYDPNAQFPSSLPSNGTASWNITKATKTLTSAISANASLSIGYSNVDWDFLKVFYGWAAVQYQAWVRGEIVVGGHETQHVILHTDAILEYWIDDKHYFGGDFYSYRNAPSVMHLTPGSHRVDLRLVRDVRAFGGILEPTIDVVVDVRQVTGALELAKPGILMSDAIGGKLVSSIGSVYLRNTGQEDIEIVSIGRSIDSSHSTLRESGLNAQTLYHSLPITIVAGQTKPVVLNVRPAEGNASVVKLDITYKTARSAHSRTLSVSQPLNHVALYAPHKITYLHPGGMVSYAMLRPPAKNSTCEPGRSKLPILLQFHGSGLEADNPMVYGALNSLPDLCAWVLFPTGVTPWSGDDWHSWGFADVEAAISAIPRWIEDNSWTGHGIDTNRWIPSGHSNGGQGTWFALTHRPDKVLAAAPVSGYSSIEKYVSYELWQSADPKRKATISASLNNYRHEMLMSNARGIPIQQQHGEVDNNVPAFHSRLLAQQLYLENTSSTYNEVAGFNHWWEGVMTTSQLVSFYYKQTNSEEILLRRLKQFTVMVGDPGDMESKSGIRVKHLEDPGRYGRVSVRGNIIRTSNVQDLEFDLALWTESVTIDEQRVELSESSVAAGGTISVYKSTDGWRPSSIGKGAVQLQRNGRQLGSMTALLRTRGAFIIRHSGSTATLHIALQISSSLHQYFLADTNILHSVLDPITPGDSGNVITLGVASSLKTVKSSFPIHVDESGVVIRDHQGQEHRYGKEARGVAFLHPLEDERLELVLWGTDEEGLQQAARLVPLLTGVGQPDFVVFGQSAKWKGIQGTLAMGFFDSNWEVAPCSVIDSEFDTYGAEDWD
ncbi:uncharacterized protein SETTUDRAFT_149188 [Exserohilum turcica Et28A]|uniref:Peptidase S9 prolyl oligopeptidase catalytic domain-containing protein n=1 Tax=Exserohilum turcicum (strain 28A) TaxID=671987 RepID=R0IVA6_EXST2|nr:uncharacterized protein SETTUDRAFT_149188 [Exserohilum turcica Et28A]EOA88541.1 hypothetical protein SETTUDRAFT_149188 [Exserohilum turcica Et28A]